MVHKAVVTTQVVVVTQAHGQQVHGVHVQAHAAAVTEHNHAVSAVAVETVNVIPPPNQPQANPAKTLRRVLKFAHGVHLLYICIQWKMRVLA